MRERWVGPRGRFERSDERKERGFCATVRYVRLHLAFLVVPLGLFVACAETKQALNEISTGTKRAFRSIGKTCPEGAKGRAVGAADADAALGCFQKAVGSEDPELLLRIVCHGRAPMHCKHDEGDTKTAETEVKQLAKSTWTDILGSWTDASEKVTVYAIDNQRTTDRVSTVTACRIAEPLPSDAAGSDAGAAPGLGWAICDVDSMLRETARKKSGS